MSVLEFVISNCAALTDVLAVTDDVRKKEDILWNHLHSCTKQNTDINDFRSDLEWFNVTRQLSLQKDLKGKIVVLDFFTYCCINCMHVLPDLKLLEDTFSVSDGLVVIGVHSAKFDNEKDSANILAAVQRYGISHPVVNDSEGTMWNELGIPCWPTLLILGPSNEPLFLIIGEGHKDELFLYVRSALNYFRSQGQLSDHSLPVSLTSHHKPTPKSLLSFPGKVAVWSPNENNNVKQCSSKTVSNGKQTNNNIAESIVTERKMADLKIAISDTGNHQVLIVNGRGNIQFKIGGNDSGFKDGSFTEAQFNSPQGLVFHGPNLLYVADTNSHAIRKVDLEAETVTTLVGTGTQGYDFSGGKLWTEQVISSPWDVCLISSTLLKQNHFDKQENIDSEDVLLIAMAGTHQIWALFLQTTEWWKGKLMVAGTCIAIAGNGKEENRNNSYPHSASFAQPSGLTVAPEFSAVFLADSESSTVRRISLLDGKVSSVVGGDKNPFNLFAYGDIDGKQCNAKLQHPLGVTWCPHTKRLYVADSYNHKIKIVDVETNTCTTFLGDGHPGDTCSNIATIQDVKLSEPGGLCVSSDGQCLFVADTNNHCIKVVHLNENRIEKLHISMCSDKEDNVQLCENFSCVALQNDVYLNPVGGTLKIVLSVSLGCNLSLTTSAPQRWKLQLPDSSWVSTEYSGNYSPEHVVSIQVPDAVEGTSVTIFINYKLFVCQKDISCTMKTFQIPVTITRVAGAPTTVTHNVNHTVLE